VREDNILVTHRSLRLLWVGPRACVPQPSRSLLPLRYVLSVTLSPSGWIQTDNKDGGGEG